MGPERCANFATPFIWRARCADARMWPSVDARGANSSIGARFGSLGLTTPLESAFVPKPRFGQSVWSAAICHLAEVNRVTQRWRGASACPEMRYKSFIVCGLFEKLDSGFLRHVVGMEPAHLQAGC